MKKYRRILLATDFSPASRPAFKEAIEMAKSNRAALVIAHVLQLPIPFSPDGYLLPRTVDELDAAVRQHALRELESLLKVARKAGLRAEGLLLKGGPEEAIARAAKKHSSDLVVVGTRGRTGLPRLILGSVASRIIAAAPCPVLAVPHRGASRGR
jgi:nucleotide-binding universal stress UspA family protein